MPRLTVTGTNIDAPDANALADFYRRLLGWTTRTEEPGWVVIQPGACDQAPWRDVELPDRVALRPSRLAGRTR